MFIKGLALGLLATGLNFAILYLGIGWLMKRQSTAGKVLVPLSYALRYLIFGALVFIFLKFHLGSLWGLLAGVSIGIAGALTWQGINAASRRSNRVQP